MTRSERIVAVSIAAAFLLSAHSVCGQQSSTAPPSAPPGTGAARAPTTPRLPAAMPPKPPRVTCSGDQLSIVAENSTLGSILDAIHVCIRAEIVVPEGAAGERLFVELGPGPVRAVITELLSSTDFDYVVEASLSDPQTIQTVLLTPHADDSQAVVEASSGSKFPNWRDWLEAQQNHGQPVSTPADESDQQAEAAALPESVETAVSPASSTPGEGTPNPVTLPSDNTDPAASVIASAPVEPDSPEDESNQSEQMIADLQRLYDKRKLMVEHQRTTVR